MTLYGCINYRNKLTAQNPHAPYRVIYPDVQRVAVATIVAETEVMFPVDKQSIAAAGVVIENAAYSCEAQTLEEAQYLCAVLNSGVIDTRLSALRSREQKAHPHVHKKIFDVAPIPQFDPADPHHAALVQLCQTCAQLVTAWKASGMDGATDIGVLRRKARLVIAGELVQIDAHVSALLGS